MGIALIPSYLIRAEDIRLVLPNGTQRYILNIGWDDSMTYDSARLYVTYPDMTGWIEVEGTPAWLQAEVSKMGKGHRLLLWQKGKHLKQASDDFTTIESMRESGMVKSMMNRIRADDERMRDRLEDSGGRIHNLAMPANPKRLYMWEYNGRLIVSGKPMTTIMANTHAIDSDDAVISITATPMYPDYGKHTRKRAWFRHMCKYMGIELVEHE